VQNTSWGNSSGSGDWSTGPNWNHGEPGSEATAVFGPSSSTRTITVSGAVSTGAVLLDDTNTTLNVGLELTLTRGVDDLAGTILLGTGAFLTAQSVREEGAGAALDLTQNNATVVLTGAQDAANPGNGPLAIIDATTVVVKNSVLDAGGQTTPHTTGGYIAIGDTAGPIANPAMTVTSGAQVFATYTRLGSGPISGGTLSISGPNTRYIDVGDPTDSANTRGDMLIGTSGATSGAVQTAVLAVANSATLTETSYAEIAPAIGTDGSVSVTSGGQWNIGIGDSQPGFLTVGQVGSGTLTIDAGLVAVGSGGTIAVSGTSVAIPYAVDIGVSTGATGVVVVTDGGALTTAADIRVGDAGAGLLSVIGGDVHAGSGNLDIGSQGIVTVSANGSIGIDDNLLVWQGSTVSVDTTSRLDVGGSTTIIGNLNVDPGHALSGGGLINAAIIDNGSVVAASGNTLEITGSIGGIGALTIAANAALQLDTAPSAGIPVFFAAGSSERLILNAPGTSFANSIVDLNNGDVIEIAGLSITSASLTSGGTVTVQTSGGSYLLTDVGFAAGAAQTFLTGHDATTGNDFIQVACFRDGTHITTDRGETPVEMLQPGDRVFDHLRGTFAPITWIGRRRIECRHHPKPRQVWPVRIAASTFGLGLPNRDLYLSPDHALYLEGVLIPVKHLINHSSIVQISVEIVTYYHVGLQQHGVLLAEGLPAESHLDIGDRTDFDNAGQVTRLHPDFASRSWEAEGCAPLVVTGPLLRAIRNKLRRAA